MIYLEGGEGGLGGSLTAQMRRLALVSSPRCNCWQHTHSIAHALYDHQPPSTAPPLQPFEAYGIGRSAAVPTPNLQKAIGLKAGVVSSGNSLDHMPRDLEIMRQHDTAIKVQSLGWI